MLIFRGGNWAEHRLWLLTTLVISVAAGLWYGVECRQIGRLAGGSSLPGFVFGVVGGLIIVFEMLLWLRKRYRAVRIGRAKLWLKAHIWLGLLSVPLLVLHSGFHWVGGALAAALMLAFAIVIVSGIWGLALQQVLPKVMLENIPAETIHSQIDRVLAQHLDEAERIVRIACGREEREPAADARGITQPQAFLVVGAVRESGPIQGRLLQTRTQVARIADSEPLLVFFEQIMSPYLRRTEHPGSPLASPKQASLIFQNLRTRLDPAAGGIVAVLEDLCEQSRQLDLQRRLHVWLHVWLCAHLPLSVVLFVLMLVHIYIALKYV